MAEMLVPVQPLSEERSHTPDSEDSALHAEFPERRPPIPRRAVAADCPLLDAAKKSADGIRAAEARAVAAAERAAKAEKAAQRSRTAAGIPATSSDARQASVTVSGGCTGVRPMERRVTRGVKVSFSFGKVRVVVTMNSAVAVLLAAATLRCSCSTESIWVTSGIRRSTRPSARSPV